MDLDWTLAAVGPVTLVRLRLRNGRTTDRRVRLRNRLDGPVLPPRRHGTPEAGWDRDGVTTVVPAGGTAALGYACPASETEPPVAVDEVDSVGDSPAPTPADAVRQLGDHRPPRDALEASRGDRTADDEPVEEEPMGGQGAVELASSAADNHGRTGGTEVDPRSDPSPSLSADAETLLSPYRTRVETAEALGVVGVSDATALVDANGGLRGVERLADELDSDARELRARAVAARPPIDALRRLS